MALQETLAAASRDPIVQVVVKGSRLGADPETRRESRWHVMHATQKLLLQQFLLACHVSVDRHTTSTLTTNSMTDDTELQARIAAISGQINHHKQRQPPYSQPPSHHYSPPSHRGYGRWTPYGRGGYPKQPMYQNRTLVVNGSSAPTPTSTASTDHVAVTGAPSTSPETLVRPRGTNNQLVTRQVQVREQEQRMAKRQKKNQLETSRLITHISSSTDQDNREIDVNGIRFRLKGDGSKLVRVSGMLCPDSSYTPMTLLRSCLADDAAKTTPKRTVIAGVSFLRTKNGNLIRAVAVNNNARYSTCVPLSKRTHSLLKRDRSRITKPQCEHFTKHGTCSSYTSPGYAVARTRLHRNRTPQSGKPPCSSLTLLAGVCPFGQDCRFSHDPNKVAICKDFLKTGSCARDENCDLSHEMTYHRVPACTFFLRGNCTNDACRFPHIHVSSTAPVCRAFATLGFCAKGAECDKRHVVECPDYANHGRCANRESGKCQLPHPDRASTLRKAAHRQAKIGSDEQSDMSSDDDEDHDENMDDVDSDAEDLFMGSGDDTHALTQQQDYVHL